MHVLSGEWVSCTFNLACFGKAERGSGEQRVRLAGGEART